MYYQIQTDASDKRWWDYSALFKTRNARSRLICVMGMAFFGQWYVLIPHQQQWQSGDLDAFRSSYTYNLFPQVWQQYRLILPSRDDENCWN
jgi:hypothetical protein